MKLVLDLIHQLGKVLPLHLTALVMEIEPNVFNELVLDLLHDARKLCANSELRPLFVDKVYEYLLSILTFDLIDMLLSEGHRFLMIFVDYNCWAPFHSWLLAPESWDRATCLQVSCYTHGITSLEESQDMLSLDEISNISLAIDAADNKSAAWPADILL